MRPGAVADANIVFDTYLHEGADKLFETKFFKFSGVTNTARYETGCDIHTNCYAFVGIPATSGYRNHGSPLWVSSAYMEGIFDQEVFVFQWFNAKVGTSGAWLQLNNGTVPYDKGYTNNPVLVAKLYGMAA